MMKRVCKCCPDGYEVCVKSLADTPEVECLFNGERGLYAREICETAPGLPTMDRSKCDTNDDCDGQIVGSKCSNSSCECPFPKEYIRPQLINNMTSYCGDISGLVYENFNDFVNMYSNLRRRWFSSGDGSKTTLSRQGTEDEWKLMLELSKCCPKGTDVFVKRNDASPQLDCLSRGQKGLQVTGQCGCFTDDDCTKIAKSICNPISHTCTCPQGTEYVLPQPRKNWAGYCNGIGGLVKTYTSNSVNVVKSWFTSENRQRPSLGGSQFGATVRREGTPEELKEMDTLCECCPPGSIACVRRDASTEAVCLVNGHHGLQATEACDPTTTDPSTVNIPTSADITQQTATSSGPTVGHGGFSQALVDVAPTGEESTAIVGKEAAGSLVGAAATTVINPRTAVVLVVSMMVLLVVGVVTCILAELGSGSGHGMQIGSGFKQTRKRPQWRKSSPAGGSETEPMPVDPQSIELLSSPPLNED
eukprot:GHVQ01035475.1.p1 GENE.GHVQ01035475.1~~GHVQ01035475.1.p1  ORF type:complete len:475 (+),score=41.55 GHVQ01035475.1:184-1608(+)